MPEPPLPSFFFCVHVGASFFFAVLGLPASLAVFFFLVSVFFFCGTGVARIPGYLELLFFLFFFFCGTGVGRIPGCLNRTVPNESTKWPHRPL